MTTTETSADKLPDSAIRLIHLVRVAHRQANQDLEQACKERLVRDYGITIGFICCSSVDADVAKTARTT